MARLLSEIPLEQLASRDKLGVLQLMYGSHNKTEIAYVSVVDAENQTLASVAATGIDIPTAAVPRAPASWYGERKLQSPGGARQFIEFYAPVLVDKQLRAYIRLGYFKPSLAFEFARLPIVASQALLIFLLAPLFYFLLKSEIRPIQLIQSALNKQIQSGDLQNLDIKTSGQLAEFMHNFNAYVEYAKGRVQYIKQEQDSVVASTRVLAYKYSRTEAILQAYPDGILVLNGGGDAVFANEKLGDLLNVSPKEIVESDPASWCENTQICDFIRNCERSAAASLEGIVVELENGAHPISLAVNAYPLFGISHAEKNESVLICFADITAQSLAQASRDEFVAHISHELKTPLSTLSMYSEALIGPEAKDENFRTDAVNIIFDEVERMVSLVNNLLSITKIEMGSLGIDRQRVKLGELMQDTFDSISRSGRGNNLKYSIDLPADIGAVAADKSLLRIVINNLLTNAVKYNRPGGTVSLSLVDSPNTVVISVRDSGIGIAPQDQIQIFDKFYRSDSTEVREIGGHGLGLSLARDIVRLHHGSITVKSEVGKGSEFIVELPKEQEFLKLAG